jgi:Ca2+-binding RTX toxin-like protein
VQVNVTGGTASNSDYDANGLPITVTFGIDETSKTIAIPIQQDAQLEQTESINFSLSSINNPAVGTIETAIGSVNTAKLEILDDDRPIILTGTSRKDRLIGNELDNVIVGNGGNDFLCGEGGGDRLFGGKGSDKLKGGIGRDVLALETGSGRDVIQDFRDRQDKLGLTAGMKFKQLKIMQQGQNTLISMGGDQLALLTNVRSNLIAKADFIDL